MMMKMMKQWYKGQGASTESSKANVGGCGGVYKRGRQTQTGNGDCGQAHVRRSFFSPGGQLRPWQYTSMFLGRLIHFLSSISSNLPTKYGNDGIHDFSTASRKAPRCCHSFFTLRSIRKSGKGGPGQKPRIKSSAYDCVTEGVITSIDCLIWPGLWIRDAK